MNEISPAAFQALLAQQTSEVLLSFIRVEHPSLPAPRRLVCNTQPITRLDGVYQPYAFNAPSPAQKEDRVAQTTITVDNTDLELGAILRTLVGMPTVTLFTALASQPNVIEEGPYVFSLTGMQGDMNTISGQLGYDTSIWDQNFPAQTYMPSNSQGLFA
ncbi:MAG: DUF1833 family protein [Rhodanobacter sp.]